MDVPQELILHLSALTEALDEPGTDLQAMLAVLADDLRTAVPSFLGLVMTVTSDGHADGVTLNSLPPRSADAIGSTLMVPLDLLGVSGPGGRVIFYAGRSGAFVDLAADTRFAFELDGQVVLDRHLPTPEHPIEQSGTSETTGSRTVNRAVGALISRGYTPEEAHRELHNHASRTGVSVFRAAEAILNSSTPPESNHPDS